MYKYYILRGKISRNKVQISRNNVQISRNKVQIARYIGNMAKICNDGKFNRMTKQLSI